MAALRMSYVVHSCSTKHLEVKSALISATNPSYSRQWLARGVPRHRKNLQSRRKSIGCKCNGHSAHVTMGLKLVESYDGSFQLEPQSDQKLRSLLSSKTFCDQVAQNSGIEGVPSFEFTGELFKPVPWSANTRHGMPQVVWLVI